MVDIYLTASQFGKYPGLATSTSVNNCYILFNLVVTQVGGVGVGTYLRLGAY